MVNNFLNESEQKNLLIELISCVKQQNEDDILRIQTLLYLNKEGCTIADITAKLFPNFSTQDVEQIVAIWVQPYLASTSSRRTQTLQSKTTSLAETFCQFLDLYKAKVINLQQLIVFLKDFLQTTLNIQVTTDSIRALVKELWLYNPISNKKDPFVRGDVPKIIFDYSTYDDVAKQFMLVSSTWRNKILSLLRNQTEITNGSTVRHTLTSGGVDLTLRNLLVPKMLNEIHPAKHYNWQSITLSAYNLPENLKNYLQEQSSLNAYRIKEVVSFPSEIIKLYEDTTNIAEGVAVSQKLIPTQVGSYSVDCLGDSFSLEELLFPQTSSNFFSLHVTNLLNLGEYFVLVVRKQVGQKQIASPKAFAPTEVILMAKDSALINDNFLLQKLNALGRLSIPLVEVICVKHNLRKFFNGTLNPESINAAKEGQPGCIGLSNIQVGSITHNPPGATIKKIKPQNSSTRIYGMLTKYIPPGILDNEIFKLKTLAELSKRGSQKLIIATLMNCIYSKAFISPMAIFVQPPEMHTIFYPACSLSVLSELFVSSFQLTLLEKVVMLEKIVGNILFSKLILEYTPGYICPGNIFLYYSNYLHPDTMQRLGCKIDVLLDLIGAGGNEIPTGATAISDYENRYLSPKKVRNEHTTIMQEILYVLGLIFHLFNLQGVYSSHSWSFNTSHPSYARSSEIRRMTNFIPQQDPTIGLGSQFIKLLSSINIFIYATILKNCDKSTNYDPASIYSLGFKHPEINNILGILGNYCIIQSQQEQISPITCFTALHNLLQMTIRLVNINYNKGSEVDDQQKNKIQEAFTAEAALKKLFEDYTPHDRQGRRGGTEEWDSYFERHKRPPLTYNFNQITSISLSKAAKEYLPDEYKEYLPKMNI